MLEYKKIHWQISLSLFNPEYKNIFLISLHLLKTYWLVLNQFTLMALVMYNALNQLRFSIYRY